MRTIPPIRSRSAREATASGTSLRPRRPSLDGRSASTVTFGHSRTIADAAAAARGTRCSQLSKTSSARLGLRCATRFSSESPSLSTLIPAALPIVAGTRLPSLKGANSTNHVPSGLLSRRLAATCNEMRVLPTPPDPMSVSNRCLARSAVISATSPSRPTNEVNCSGRLFGMALSVRSRRKRVGEAPARRAGRSARAARGA